MRAVFTEVLQTEVPVFQSGTACDEMATAAFIRSDAHVLTLSSAASRHVIGRPLDLSHISWRTCVADLLTDHIRRSSTVRSKCTVALASNKHA